MRVLLLDIGLAVQCDPDGRPVELDAQRVPDVARYRRVDVLQGVAAAVRGVMELHMVLERVGAGHVVVVAVLPAPEDAAGLVLPALERLELDLDEAALERAPAQHAPRERAPSRLMQHVWSA